MKKLSKLFFASALALPLAACTGDDAADDDGGAGTVAGTADGGGTADTGGDGVTDDDPDVDPDDDPDDMTDESPDSPDTADDTSDDSPGGMACAEQCTADDQCTLMGMDLGFTCSTNSGFCISACADDAACQATGSGWTAQPCAASADCLSPDAICVDYGGEMGGCATPPSKALPCSTLMQEEVMINDVDGNEVTVCASTALTCQDFDGDMVCAGEAVEFTCADLMCPDPLTCDDADPACTCASDDDCAAAGDPYGPTCHADGFCYRSCEGDADCEGLTTSFDGTTASCIGV